MISWPCPQCQSRLRCPETAIGRKLPCPKCRYLNIVPEQSQAQPANVQTPVGQSVQAVTMGSPTDSELDKLRKARRNVVARPVEQPGSRAIADQSTRKSIIKPLLIVSVATILVLAIGVGILATMQADRSGPDARMPLHSPPPAVALANKDDLATKDGQFTNDDTRDASVAHTPNPDAPNAALPVSENSQGEAAAPAAIGTASIAANLVEGCQANQVLASIAFSDPYNNPFEAQLELRPGPQSAAEDLQVTALVGDCVQGWVLTETLSATWTKTDRSPQRFNIKVLGGGWSQVAMARHGRMLRGGVWKSDPLLQLIVRNDQLRNAGMPVWQLATMLIEPGGDFNYHRNQFTNTPYQVSRSQWDFAANVLQQLRPLAKKVSEQEQQIAQQKKRSTTVRLPLEQAIAQQRINAHFRFDSLLKPQCLIELEPAAAESNSRFELWTDEALCAYVELKPGDTRRFFLCDFQLSTAKATSVQNSRVMQWSGLAYSSSPIEPEPLHLNALYEIFSGTKSPRFESCDAVVAHIAASTDANLVKKQIAIWIANNPQLTVDQLHALGKRYDDPQLSALPSSVVDDARLMVRQSQWIVSQLPRELQRGEVFNYFVGTWEATDSRLAQQAAGNFRLWQMDMNPSRSEADWNSIRRKLIEGFSSGIEVEPITLKLMPDLTFEALGSRLGRPVAAHGNWKWNGARLEFPLWKDGKGNDPFLENGIRANLPISLPVAGDTLGEEISPDSKTQPRGTFLRKTSSAATASSGSTQNISSQFREDPLTQALNTVAIQAQAAAIDQKNTRVFTLNEAVESGLVGLHVELRQQYLDSPDFMNRLGHITIERMPTAKGLNLKLLCCAPFTLAMDADVSSELNAVFVCTDTSPLEMSASTSQAEIDCRCIPTSWENLAIIQSFDSQRIEPWNGLNSHLCATRGAIVFGLGIEARKEFYGSLWEPFLKSHENKVPEHLITPPMEIVGRMPNVSTSRGLPTAMLFLQHPEWRAPDLFNYVRKPDVSRSFPPADLKTYLEREYALMQGTQDTHEVISGGNLKSYHIAKFFRESFSKLPQELQQAKALAECHAYFVGTWSTTSVDKARQLLSNLPPGRPLSLTDHALVSQDVRTGTQAFKVSVVETDLQMLVDHTYALKSVRSGQPIEEVGYWQWDGAQLWLGSSPYFVVENCLVSARLNGSGAYGNFLSRVGTISAPATQPGVAAMNPTTKPNAANEDTSESVTPRPGPITMKRDSLVGQWRSADREAAKRVRRTVLLRELDRSVPEQVRQKNSEMRQLFEQLKSQVDLEADKDLQIPPWELTLRAASFQLKSSDPTRKLEFEGKWKLRDNKLQLELYKTLSLELELIDDVLFGQSIPTGEVYFSKEPETPR